MLLIVQYPYMKSVRFNWFVEGETLPFGAVVLERWEDGEWTLG